ncbi:uncharacterized protein [Watersipora subatra]|uniref:uncharacterized protein n=1 Tax=Watersipora subatra TaxID=2589382 RepID=UPI00355C3224
MNKALPDELTRVRRFTLYENLTATWLDPRTPFPLTISFQNYIDRDISTETQDNIAVNCARLWAEQTGISFKYVRNEVSNILISFEPIVGDPGPGGTVGEAGPPQPHKTPPSTYLRLDSREVWKPRFSSPGAGLSLEEVICHELGHNLGLGHSEVEEALMFGIIGLREHDVRLDQDDINGIQSLYGLPDGQTVIVDNEANQGRNRSSQSERGSVRRVRCGRRSGRRRRRCQQRRNFRMRNLNRSRSRSIRRRDIKPKTDKVSYDRGVRDYISSTSGSRFRF